MAKISGSFFNMKMSGTLGEVVFDRRGFVRVKGQPRDAHSPSQGNFRQTMSVAQKCATVCGADTRQALKEIAANSAQWRAALVKALIGPQRQVYLANLGRYNDPTVDQAGWEAAAVEMGLQPIHLEYAAEAEVSPGAQLFVLAATLYRLGLYTSLGQPNGNAAVWQQQIAA